ncbi:MAG: hypothetical protein ACRCUT_12250, partial [Spirochaetota bacterium]
GIYFDTDISQFYNLWSVSLRETLPLSKTPFASALPESFEEQPKGESGVAITDHTDINRDNSSSFFGVELLYGIVAFKKVDTKRHFRLLPLSYLTWDSASDNQITWIGNYISYKEGDFAYRVFFPFYGSQKSGASHREGYLLNAYWNEYTAETDMTERSILWPLINWYSSPASHGFRILPLLTWHKGKTQESIRTEKSFTVPLYYASGRTDDLTGKKLSAFSISPLHFYSRKTDADHSSLTWGSLVPALFYSKETGLSRYTVSAPASGKKDDPVTMETRTTYMTHWLFPLYYTRSRIEEAGGKSTSDFTLLGLPLLYYHSTAAAENGKPESRKTDGSFFFMGYYSRFSSFSDSTDILFGLYSSYSDRNGGCSRSAFYGLGKVQKEGNSFYSWLHPFYYYSRENGGTNFWLALGLAHKTHTQNGDSGLSLAWWLFSTSKSHGYEYMRGSYQPVREKTTWLFPLFYNSSRTGDNTPYSGHSTATLLHYRNYRDDGHGNYSSTFWAPLLPLAYYHAEQDRIHINLGLLFDYNKNLSQQFTRIWASPLFFLKTGDDGYFHIFPLWASSWNKKEQDWKFFALGLYLRKNPEYTRQNFLYLYDRVSRPSLQSSEISLLFTSLEYDISPEVRSMRAAWGLLADMRFPGRTATMI